ncbi:hypothetical protein [Vibrio barjaei]|uniref:hypothetical protein n=1 Tax=Vibrio barjaei TaxID=1676683 RepID=UPI00228457BD|nr:hypothetical protein [Vibrio barjaei]MCY9870372.1 hypothetical protein [Vibrio barjaei]
MNQQTFAVNHGYIDVRATTEDEALDKVNLVFHGDQVKALASLEGIHNFQIGGTPIQADGSEYEIPSLAESLELNARAMGPLSEVEVQILYHGEPLYIQMANKVVFKDITDAYQKHNGMDLELSEESMLIFNHVLSETEIENVNIILKRVVTII